MSEELRIVFIRKDIPAIAKQVEELGEIVTADEAAQLHEHAFKADIKDPRYPITIICGNHTDPVYKHMQKNKRYTARQIRF